MRAVIEPGKCWQVRLQHLGVKVTHMEDEEYCLIPMGGVLPRLPQRVLGIGGTGGMVHPSTGESRASRLAMVASESDEHLYC